MLGIRWRLGAVFAVMAVAVVCFGLQSAGTVTAEDKNDQPSVSSESGSADAGASSDQKSASKKNDRKAKRNTRKTPEKKTRTRSSQPASGGQRSGQATGGSVGGVLPGGAGSVTGGAAVGGGPNGTGGDGNGGQGPVVGEQIGAAGQAGGTQQYAVPDPKLVQKVVALQDKHSDGLMKQEGVVGTATGLTKDGRVVLHVYTSGAGNPKIPGKLDDIETEVMQTGPIRPLSGFAGSSKFDPKKRQSRPVPIGTSAFNEISPACGGSSCFAGTLGCRLRAKDGSGLYALSNNHVFANENAAALGNTIVQPSPGDNNCLCDSEDVIGQLYRFKTIRVIGSGGFNLMDAAIIKTTDKLISSATLADGYGAPRTFPWKQAFLGQRVMKYGRTTGFTKGIVVGINSLTAVPYDPGLAIFVRQVTIIGEGGQFSDGGDSGSLVVDRDRFPVGLLFAGNGIVTISNPIQDVLDEFGMEIDGDDAEDFSPPGKIGSANNPK